MHSDKDRYSVKSKLEVSKNDGNWISSPTVLVETKGDTETLYDRRAEGMAETLIVKCPELAFYESFQIEKGSLVDKTSIHSLGFSTSKIFSTFQCEDNDKPYTSEINIEIHDAAWNEDPPKSSGKNTSPPQAYFYFSLMQE